jgi:hypothetical protein
LWWFFFKIFQNIPLNMLHGFVFYSKMMNFHTKNTHTHSFSPSLSLWQVFAEWLINLKKNI